MKIAIDNRALPNTGMGHYAGKLIEKLPQLYPEDQFIPFTDSLQPSRESFKQKYVSGLKRMYWEQVGLGKWLTSMNIDLLHNPRNLGIPIWSPCRCVVTIHDLIPLVYPKQYLSSAIESAYYQLLLKISISKAVKIITDSVFSREELVRLVGVKREQIVVTYLGCSDTFRQVDDEKTLAQVRKKYGLDQPYMITIGGSEYRKNIARLIKVFQSKFSNQYKLLVVGGAWRSSDLRESTPAQKNIVFAGAVSQEELIALYSAATVFVFPSLYEGFGLPVLEAMACGVPVAAANSSSIPEVAGEAALLFNPVVEDEMYCAIKSILDSKSLQNELVAKGFEQIKHFKWEDTLKNTMQVYRDSISQK